MRAIRDDRVRTGRIWIIAATAVAALGIGLTAGLIAHDRVFPRSISDSAKPPAALGITALGRLQPAGGVIPVYGPPGDRIEKLISATHDQPIAPGTVVKKDQPLVELASKRHREMELHVARIQHKESLQAVEAATAAGQKKIEAARAELEQVSANEQHDLAAIQAKLDYLAEAYKIADGQVMRLEALRNEGVKVADEDLEKARLARAQAKAEQSASQSALEKAKTTYRESTKAARAKIAAAEEELKEAVARVPVESAAERLKVAESLVRQTTIKAPVDGVVLKVVGHEGQPTGLEPILYIAPDGEMVAVAEVYESDLERLSELVRTGPVLAEVSSPALPAGRILRGRVDSERNINRMIARNQVFALGPREDADRRVVEVTVLLDPESSSIASRFIGLQVTVAFPPRKSLP